MTELNTKVEKFEEKEASNGRKYARVKTPEGWMSIFDAELIKKLREAIGKLVSLEVRTNEERGFKTITDVKVLADQPSEEVVAESKQSGKNATMYASYAKDIFCSLLDRISQQNFDSKKDEEILQLMNVAILAVKMAREEFEG